MPTFWRGLSYSCAGLPGPQNGKLSLRHFFCPRHFLLRLDSPARINASPSIPRHLLFLLFYKSCPMSEVPRIVQLIVDYDALLSRYAKQLTGNEFAGKRLVKDVFEAWYELPDTLKKENTKEQLRRLTLAICQAYNEAQNTPTPETAAL